MKRLREWEANLRNEIVRSQFLPFDRGGNDCARFVARCIVAVTGEDLSNLPAFSSYSDDLSALRFLKTLGEDGMFQLADTTFAHLGIQCIPVRSAHRGDVAFFDPAALGICWGRDSLSPGKTGLVAQPMKNARAAWRLPYGS